MSLFKVVGPGGCVVAFEAEFDGIAVDEATQPLSRNVPNKKPSTRGKHSAGFIKPPTRTVDEGEYRAAHSLGRAHGKTRHPIIC